MNLYSEGVLESVSVSTFAPNNKSVTIWYRVPDSYDAKDKSTYRVLIFFGGRNYAGKDQAAGGYDWDKWADQNKVFLLSPGFKDDIYWEPQKWSGKALLEAIALIKKKYNICDDKFLFYGYSAGAQCSNLFPAWMPEKTRAYVSHANGYFHKPNVNMKNIAALVTCGDADRDRFIINHKFIEDYRKLGANVLWKSFPNHPHDVPKGSIHLAQAFLEYYHKLCAKDLDSSLKAEKVPTRILFVGDDQDGVIYAPDSPEAKNILEEDKVYFISEELAKAWAESAKME